MEDIVYHNGKLKMKLQFLLLEENNRYIAIVPSLKLSANSKESKEKSIELLIANIKKFCKFYNTKDKLHKELSRIGWEGSLEPDHLHISSESLKSSEPKNHFESEEKEIEMDCLAY
jgi:hypothetical protein